MQKKTETYSVRNQIMINRIESASIKYPYSFIIAGVNGISPNFAADAIFTELLQQMGQLPEKPIFFANMGDFSGPGSIDRHEHYIHMVDKLTIPNICIIGGHENDDSEGLKNYRTIHGPENFYFFYGNSDFIVIDSNNHRKPTGPRIDELEFMETCLKESKKEIHIIMMHMPPNLNGHYEPRSGEEWGFKHHEKQFLSILKKYKVSLVCCSHIIGYDYYNYEGIKFVVSGNAGYAIDFDFGRSHREGYAIMPGVPPHRGSFYHFLKITVNINGQISGKIYRAFEGVTPDAKFGF